MSDKFYESPEYLTLVKPMEERAVANRKWWAENGESWQRANDLRMDISDTIRYMILFTLAGLVLAIPVTFLAVMLP